MGGTSEKGEKESKSKIDDWLSAIRRLYEKDNKIDEFKKEEGCIRAFLARLEEEEKPSGRLSMVKLEEPIARGGTGIVFRASHSRIENQHLALKFNRPRIEGDTKVLIDNELRILPLLDHNNIIRVIDVGKLDISSAEFTCPQLCFILEPLISNAMSLTKYTESLSNFEVEVNEDLLDDALLKLTLALQQWVSALAYIHESGYVFLDVKPDNAVIDKDGHLVLIDFGTVQKIDRNDPSPTPVYFSYPYAHPTIKKLAEKTSTNRVRASIKKMNLTQELDYYALGKSILELLEKISACHPHDFPQRPLFQSLYFLATRLLDGQNIQVPREGSQKRGRTEGLDEVFDGLEKEDYATIKYENLRDVSRDLDKEVGKWNLENEVPELETFPGSTIRIVPDLNTALTNRLVELIEHPLIARLKMVSQLGLVTLVYPTADHSRYDHILGAYTYTRYYINALFNDSQNCMFRNLINEKDVKLALLASVLHDLGQYPLAHDLQEVQKTIFDHSRISMDLLNDSTKDKEGRTIKDIIRDEKRGWGLEIEQVRRILGAHSAQVRLAETQTVQDFKADMLSALIDGPIDADKADYIIRDSANSRLPYGQQLDIERLLSVLTTVRIPVRPRSQHKVTIGVYEKGISSASAFSLARYLLHASIYWHHTSRILKAMLQYATVMILPRDVFHAYPDEGKIEEIHAKLVEFIKTQLIPPKDQLPKDSKLRVTKEKEKIDLTVKPNEDALSDIGKAEKETCTDWYPGMCRTDWLMLNWLKSLSSSEESKRGNALIDLILRRDLYKRVYTIHNEKTAEADETSKLVERLQELKWLEKVKLSDSIQKLVDEKLQKKGATAADTTLYPSADAVRKIFNENLAIIVDIPDYKKFSSDRPLIYVPELQSKTYYREDPPTPSHNLSHALDYLMKSTAPIRVLCHPNLRQWIGYYIQPEEMRNIIISALE